MKSKIKYIILALLLIPSIANAKLSEIKKIEEIIIENTVYNEAHFDNIISERENGTLTSINRELKTNGTYKLDENKEYIFIEDMETYLELDERTFNIKTMDKNLNEIKTKRFQELEFNSPIKQHIGDYFAMDYYDDTNKIILTKDLNKYADIPNVDEILEINKEGILVYEYNIKTPFLLDKVGDVIRTIEETDTGISRKTNKNYMIVEDTESTIKIYDNRLKVIGIIPRLEGIIQDNKGNFYGYVGPVPNMVNLATFEEAKEDFKTKEYYKYSKDLSKKEKITYEDYFNVDIGQSKHHGDLNLEDLLYILYNFDNPNSSTVSDELFTAIGNDLFVLTLGEDEKPYIYQIDRTTKEQKIFPVNINRDIGPYYEVLALQPNEEGFMLAVEGSQDIDGDYTNLVLQTYKVGEDEFNINTKINGQGTINVIPKAKRGTEVEVKITPDDGYIIDSIYIINKDGSKKILSSNTFIMPNEDITIEATFTIKNPETNVFMSSIVIALIISIPSIIFLNYLKKKTNRYQI